MSKKGRHAKSKKGGASVAPPRNGRSEAPGTPPPQAHPSHPHAVTLEPPSNPSRADAEGPAPGALASTTASGDSASHRGVDAESFPPVERLASGAPELEHQFFSFPSSQPLTRYGDAHPYEPELADPRILRKLSRHAVERRAALAKYVKIAMGIATAVGVAAVGKVTLLHEAAGTVSYAHADEARVQAAAIAAPLAPTSTPTLAEPPPALGAPPSIATAPSAEAPLAEAPPSASPSAPPVDAPSVPAASSSAAPIAFDPKEAAKQKAATQRALDRNKLGDAIEAGEKSVALDPTDSQAWLLLGAAYQEKGDWKNARRCYRACLHQGKRGDKTECAEMLR